MKRTITAILLLLAITAGKPSMAQQLTFYYYPDANVYYNPAKKQYIYYTNGAWMPVAVLPGTVVVRNKPRVVVYSNTPQVWILNKEHVVKYKNQPNGKAVGYKGTNPNKAQGKAKGKGKN
jgi:hypothetical protein